GGLGAHLGLGEVVRPGRGRGARVLVWAAVAEDGGAFALELFKSRHELSTNGALLIAIGFAVSFVFGWIVVKTFLDYVSRHGFMLFAWWRLIVGTLRIAGLMLGLGAGWSSPSLCSIGPRRPSVPPALHNLP